MIPTACPQIPQSGVVQGNSLELLKCIPDNSISAIVTDPPYAMSVASTRARAQMNTEWDQFATPTDFQKWTTQWGHEAFRVLKPGGSIVSFGGARQYHRMASGLEDAGFHTKDMLEWLYYTGFPKNKQQLKPGHEPMYWGVKPGGSVTINVEANRIPYQEDDKPKGNPRDWNANFWQNGHTKKEKFPEYKPSNTGRYPVNVVVAQDCDPSEKACRFLRIHDQMNVSDIPKPSPAERQESRHPTTKPVNLMQWVTRLVTNPGDKIIDPFVGSGTTCVAAHNVGVHCLGFELDKQMAKDADKRLDKHPLVTPQK